MTDNGTMPGFTPEQEWALKQVVKEGVREGVADALKDPRCPRPCEDVDALQSVVFGRTEKGIVGLDQRTDRNERQLTELLESIVWFKRLLYGALASGSVALLATLIQFAFTGR